MKGNEREGVREGGREGEIGIQKGTEEISEIER